MGTEPADRPSGALHRGIAPVSLAARAWGIAAAYFLFATLWIYFSDQALGFLVADRRLRARLPRIRHGTVPERHLPPPDAAAVLFHRILVHIVVGEAAPIPVVAQRLALTPPPVPHGAG